ncbi:hypothetical protein LX16_3314 [Stackebrandtia albiflava]|uniref:Uncharacterized protein n=1 Tax=Stackebrandtia albiflava TaxID=406432 RepID=A0A562V3U3_9ACTN|nr:hypothetical protein [Stackebrandtia albiflava]TWJ12554.1 hypothetical protein LX16_3314 [Stackebrandtia albiflava]
MSHEPIDLGHFDLDGSRWYVTTSSVPDMVRIYSRGMLVATVSRYLNVVRGSWGAPYVERSKEWRGAREAAAMRVWDEFRRRGDHRGRR